MTTSSQINLTKFPVPLFLKASLNPILGSDISIQWMVVRSPQKGFYIQSVFYFAQCEDHPKRFYNGQDRNWDSESNA